MVLGPLLFLPQSHLRRAYQRQRRRFQAHIPKSGRGRPQANPRKAGKSKYPLSRLITFGLSGVVSFSRKPLRLGIIAGSLVAIFGFLYALFTIVQSLFMQELPSGYATIVVLLSLFSGFQLVFLGIIGEYIGSIHTQVLKRPLVIEKERINF